ncbi:MAG: dihydrolipoamide acyltransferase component of branched-chain alpha-keto acid dehydrogenase complex [Ktedonobacterales bacterium]|jgi:pyruvate dehydrogenase E2 component (dihydrolipoamide acetyltransferase)|nr:MAG: dihydrolipoamide acyltransferase component of branched-chain alpha-keto acid dehydrogenase complex [Ktedonobacterales bacterium]
MGQFRLPDLGEGLEEAQLVEWLVKTGDSVNLNQPLCQVETAKALVDIPSPFAGTITALHAAPGDTVPVGALLVTIEEPASAASHAPAAPASAATNDGGHGPVLVGYGTEGPAQTFVRRRRAGATPAASVVASAPAPSAPATTSTLAATPAADSVNASPLVRKVAAERGIDLSAIRGTGPGGRIRMEDLDAAPAVGASGGRPATSTPIATADDEERISTVGLRKAIAARMLRAATTIPHFTEYAQFDVSALTALRERLRAQPDYADVKLTFLPFFARALVEAIRAYPVLNSRWDDEGNAIVVKKSISVGIATDTPRGLLVPVVHNAHTLDLHALATEANRLIGLARDGKLDAKSLSGSTITITNVGAAGPVDTGAPLINPPEACVVGFGAIKTRPWVVGDHIVPRPVAWISISCDHRIVDGATAAQFMGALVNRLESPDTLLS